ncbi:hypothetical protein AALB53_17700 [Lachnospiraceae bacterium 47-T17]
MGLQTDQILEDIKNDTSVEAAVDFIDVSEVRQELEADIAAAFPSRNKFADACAINSSHLSEFLRGTKKIGRDLLLSMFITLGYDLDRTQDMLRRLGMPALYVRDTRDYQIALAIRTQKSLDETDQLLQSRNLKTLTTLAKNK